VAGRARHVDLALKIVAIDVECALKNFDEDGTGTKNQYHLGRCAVCERWNKHAFARPDAEAHQGDLQRVSAIRDAYRVLDSAKLGQCPLHLGYFGTHDKAAMVQDGGNVAIDFFPQALGLLLKASKRYLQGNLL
jgi:hypothetical protein